MFTIVHHIVNPRCTLEVPIDHQRNKDASYWAYRARKNNGAFLLGDRKPHNIRAWDMYRPSKLGTETDESQSEHPDTPK